MLQSLTSESFSESLNTTFRVLVDSGAVEVKLIEVAPGRQTPRQDQFSIVFRGPEDALFGQGTYKIEHDRIGAFDLFLVPVGRDEQGFLYQAVFNRLRK
jgi:hypothetical protein